MDTIKSFIENEIENTIQNDILKIKVIHNHPPLQIIVPNCPYCEKYGNIFVK